MNDLHRLATDFAKVAAGSHAVVQAVGTESARGIVSRMREDAARSRHFRIAPTISHEQTSSGRTSTWEVGPVRGGAGSLAHIAYFGGANGGGGTIRDPQLAADEEVPVIERALLAAFGKLL